MRILIITSCTGQKRVKSPNALTCDDFALGAKHVRDRERDLKPLMTPAEDLYTGQQHKRLMQAIGAIREKVDIDLWIVSAGYGVVSGNRKLGPYECTFTERGKADLRAWADQLQIPEGFRKVASRPYDLGLLLLGDDYLTACDLKGDVRLGGPTIAFCGRSTIKKLPAIEGLKTVGLGNPEATRFSCGLVGLKGEVTARLLNRLMDEPTLLIELIKPNQNVLDLLDDGKKSEKKGRTRSVSTNVDWVISLPNSWRDKPHRKKLRYFIPEWDDLVDPDYDFENDVHSGGTGNWTNEVYAHQMYPEPNYDGILVSKVVAEKSKSKKALINELGVHRFLRVPRSFPVMGDCGAFGYIAEKVPPYSTEEILDYYTRLDFDYGVSVDHLIVQSTMVQRRERYELTIQNAEDFLKEHKALGLNWQPIGAVQGWDPKTYAEAARRYVAMGYQYIALGGLVRSSTKDILHVLSEVKEVIPNGVGLHLFGLARIDAMQRFADLGVTSVDSASLLRRAWMGTGQNYLTLDGVFYTAIRVPEAGKSFRAKRMVSEGRANASKVEALDKKCMKILRQFDQGKSSAQDVLDILAEYDHLITPDRSDTSELLRETLEDAPWKRCQCDICRRDGIQVIIFRGNNRNRRRGFHNTYVFYRLLQRALSGEDIRFISRSKVDGQLELPSFGSVGAKLAL